MIRCVFLDRSDWATKFDANVASVLYTGPPIKEKEKKRKEKTRKRKKKGKYLYQIHVLTITTFGYSMYVPSLGNQSGEDADLFAGDSSPTTKDEGEKSKAGNGSGIDAFPDLGE